LPQVEAAFSLLREVWSGAGVEPPTFRFSGVADAQLRLNAREYVAVHGCVRALTIAVVAVMVAVRCERTFRWEGGESSSSPDP
jgi:hypothetical protein